MKPIQFSLRAATTDPVSTAKRADLPVLDEPQEAPQVASESVQDDAAPEPVEAAPEPAPTRPRRSRRASPAAPKKDRPTTRQGARGVTVWVEPDVYRQIKIAGLDLDCTTQDLMMNAIEDYLSRHQRRQKTA